MVNSLNIFLWITLLTTHTFIELTKVHTFNIRGPCSGWNTITLPLDMSHVKQRRAPDAISHLWCAEHAHPHFHARSESQRVVHDYQREKARATSHYKTLQPSLSLWLPWFPRKRCFSLPYSVVPQIHKLLHMIYDQKKVFIYLSFV